MHHIKTLRKTDQYAGYILLTLIIFGLFPYACEAADKGFTVTNNFKGTAGGSNLPQQIVAVVNTLLVIAGIIVVIFIVIGGIQFVTSVGDERKLETAKRTILYAVIGAILILLSGVLVRFIISAITI